MADTVAVTDSSSSSTEDHGGHNLSAFLCWAVVFADIGTSVYYVPGILWGQVQWQAGLFVLLTLIAFTLLIFTYAEVSVRFPEGGGVVTAAASGLTPWAGVVGGVFILGSYFLTSAISSLSGILYLGTIVQPVTHFVLPVTVVVIVLLGALNFWGVKESASVSAVIAVAALVSDVIILLTVFVNVPLDTIGKVFEKIFTGDLSGASILTGFAGAFLAFSGLESISQLSPVMKLPRRKTVNRALGLVAITVGITSPLLTIFSTVLLNSPDLLATTTIHMAVNATPDTYISALGATYGGAILSVATAVAASALLVFACNTAIIGAYHVFMALSRMGYLPAFVTATNTWRGTPHYAIWMATLIPVVVLLGVQGKIDILGDMYAFGLLGAFSLTCLSMSVIRYRDLHGVAHVSAVSVAERDGAHETISGVPWRERLSSAARGRMSDQVAARLRTTSARTQVHVGPWATRVKTAWPTLKYYLGIVTTLLVCVAWITNLFTKPLATIFGGGFTLVGVAVAFVYHQRLVRAGAAPVTPMQLLQRMPDSLLIALSSASEQNFQVIDAAVESADGHQLVFLYLSRKPTQSPRFMQFADPYLTDTIAQQTLTHAQNKAQQAGLKASFIYRLGGPGQVIDTWRIIRPDEIIAEAKIAQKVSKYVPPDYVRYQVEDGVRVAHYVRHHPQQGYQTPPIETGSGIAVGSESLGQQDGSNRPPTNEPENLMPDEEAPIAQRNGRTRPSTVHQTMPKRHVPRTGGPPASEEMPSSESAGEAEEWVWTGTDLIPKSSQEKDTRSH